jgi:hypothetical protein
LPVSPGTQRQRLSLAVQRRLNPLIRFYTLHQCGGEIAGKLNVRWFAGKDSSNSFAFRPMAIDASSEFRFRSSERQPNVRLAFEAGDYDRFGLRVITAPFDPDGFPVFRMRQTDDQA